MRRMSLVVLSILVAVVARSQERLERSAEIAKTPTRAYEYIITCDKPDGVYAVGEIATWKVVVRNEDGTMPKEGVVRFVFDGYDDKPFATQVFDLAKTGPVLTVRQAMEHPGFMRAKIYAGDDRKSRIWCVAVAPDRIPAGVREPEDFDAFWAKAIEKYDREVPWDFEMRFDGKRTTPWNDVYAYSFTAPDRSRLYGFISFPKDRSRRYPARFEVPSAGIGGWTMGPSNYQRDRTVTAILNIFPFEMAKTEKESHVPYNAWCAELKKRFGTHHYMEAGYGESVEASPTYNYLLGTRRAIKWMKTLPEVDPDNFFYWGASQGGGYGLLVMGLNNGEFKRGCILVPCQCYADGVDGRAVSHNAWRNQPTPETREIAKRTVPYLAGENFARRITCPVMFTVGFCDPICPPHGGWSCYNVCPAKEKYIVGAVNQPHGPPDPIWFGTQQWLYGEPNWQNTFGEQLRYLHTGRGRP